MYVDDLSVFARFRTLNLVEHGARRFLRCLGIAYPENCLLAVYQDRLQCTSTPKQGRHPELSRPLLRPALDDDLLLREELEGVAPWPCRSPKKLSRAPLNGK